MKLIKDLIKDNNYDYSMFNKQTRTKADMFVSYLYISEADLENEDIEIFVPNLSFILKNKDPLVSVSKFESKHKDHTGLWRKARMEIDTQPFAVIDYVNNYLRYTKDADREIDVIKRSMDHLINEYGEASGILESAKLIMYSINKTVGRLAEPKKMNKISKFKKFIAGLDYRIYTINELYKGFCKDNPLEKTTERSFVGLLDRLDNELYYFARGKYIKINESVYSEEKVSEFFFKVEDVVALKGMISTRLLLVMFSEYFPEASFEITSEYFIHSFIKCKYRGGIIEMNRMPIISFKTEKSSIAKKFQDLVSDTIPSTVKLADYTKYLENEFGFNKAYSVNMLSQISNIDNAIIYSKNGEIRRLDE